LNLYLFNHQSFYNFHSGKKTILEMGIPALCIVKLYIFLSKYFKIGFAGCSGHFIFISIIIIISQYISLFEKTNKEIKHPSMCCLSRQSLYNRYVCCLSWAITVARLTHQNCPCSSEHVKKELVGTLSLMFSSPVSRYQSCKGQRRSSSVCFDPALPSIKKIFHSQ